MADTQQTPVQIVGETAALVRERADQRHMSVDDYVGELVREDSTVDREDSTVDARERFMTGAREVLMDFGDVIDEAVGEAAA
ncbi:hypothetical protein CIB93_04625 [Streptomyces sp. WZ.A104]|uniref:hypothetical protein n=1 Tax=Streptomyces sp. WZ.A104 TaxID=2023771 RepID=UPI000BBCC7A2|nr:hypothetical protein [Streptomyces sp. WZ.A104]PCG87135.1 hypothetical protein CIB93_04625 [Streptomyces sp. WZ.A104]